MQRHHGALAEADQRQRRRRQLAGARARHRGTASSTGAGLVDADPALVRIAEGEAETIAGPTGAWPQGSGACGETKAVSGSSGLPGAADIDQVVAVGAIAVQEHHQPLGLAAWRLEPRSVEFTGHVQPAIAVRFLLVAFSCGLVSRHGLGGLHRRALAPLHRVIVGPEQMRGHPAPRPPRLGELRHLLGVGPLPSGRSAMRAASCSARSPAGQASAWPRQNSR